MSYSPSPDHPLTQAFPYFPKEEQQILLEEFREILNGMLSMGPRLQKFEERFSAHCGTRHAVAYPSCSSSLEAALIALGLQPGDEVLVPVQTFIATGMAVHLTGGVPVFTEVDTDSFAMDFEDAWARVTNRTRGAIVVHFGGLITPGLEKFCQKMQSSGRFVIEDCAHAHGSSLSGHPAGSIGDAGCFSFFPTKMMTTGEGGMLVTSRDDVAAIARSLQNLGQDMESSHELYIRPGRNNRVTEITAAMGLSQLRTLPAFLESRNRVAQQFTDKLIASGLYQPMLPSAGARSSYWKYIAVAAEPFDREKLRLLLAKDSIVVNWAYDPLLHLQPVCRDLFGCRPGMLPRSEELAGRHLCLPIHQNMRVEDAAFVTERLLLHSAEVL
jgi:perosamine synthetase